jgi:hypothetical protein
MLTVPEAKKICKEKFGHLPACGYEMRIIDEECVYPLWHTASGRVYIEDDDSQFRGWKHHLQNHQGRRHVYLTNESGSYRVWEWIG